MANILISANKAIKNNELSIFGAIKMVKRNIDNEEVATFLKEKGISVKEFDKYVTLDNVMTALGAARNSENSWELKRKGKIVTKFTAWSVLLAIGKFKKLGIIPTEPKA